MAGSTRGLADSIAPLREVSFRRLFLASTTSLIGDRFATLALAFAVLELTRSASALGLVLASQTVSLVAFLLIGGVWADRLGRRRVMVAADLARAATQGLMAVLLIMGTARLWQLVVLQVLHGAASGFFNPASTGLVPETVRPAHVQRANALLELGSSVGGILGPIASGLIVAATTPGWAIGIDAVSFLGSAFFLRGIESVPQAGPRAGVNFWKELKEGWTEVRSRAWLLGSIVQMAIFQFAFLGSLFVLGPVVAEQTYGGARAWGLIVGFFGFGNVFGAIVGLRLHPRRILVAIFLLEILETLALILLAVRPPLWVLLGGNFVAGGSLAYGSTLYEVVLQQNVPSHAISRVSAYDWMGSTVLRPLGLAAAGPVASAVGVATTFLGAATIVAASALAVLGLSSVRRLERVAEEPAVVANVKPDLV